MRSMYGNVDAALRFFIIFVLCLQNKDIGMTQSQADPCVMYMKDDNGMPRVVAAIKVKRLSIRWKAGRYCMPNGKGREVF